MITIASFVKTYICVFLPDNLTCLNVSIYFIVPRIRYVFPFQQNILLTSFRLSYNLCVSSNLYKEANYVSL